jgi:uncharacterized protein
LETGEESRKTLDARLRTSGMTVKEVGCSFTTTHFSKSGFMLRAANYIHINSNIIILLLWDGFSYGIFMKKAHFEWDEEKDKENQAKHGVSFLLEQQSFLDPQRIIVEDVSHGIEEERFYCIGRVGEGIMTVRFTYRTDVIRIYGAGYWRKGRKIYEEQNKIY